MSARAAHARALFAPLGPTYDRVGAVLSFGQDPRWRRFLVSRVPADGGRVLDVATGTGLVAARAARAGLSRHRARPERRDARSRAGRASTAGSSSSRGRRTRCRSRTPPFDHLTFTYLLRYVDDPAATLARARTRRASRAGRSRCSSSACPAGSGAPPGTSGSTSGCRSPAGSSRRAGTRSAASSARRSARSTRRIPRSGCSRSGATRGSPTSAACAG